MADMQNKKDPTTLLVESLPLSVKNNFGNLTPQQQEEFIHEYKRRSKKTGTAYIFWLFGLHYAYLGKWGTMLLYYVTFGGLSVWAIVSAFRMPKLVRDKNYDIAMEVMKDIKIIHS